ncbi:SemiSWEET family sugar transporter [Geobacter sulfurreducens]|uniref:SemiSWEET family sugar transporter n=1 Tax=Geobacter sulfurreducens TaxID=35554 RepID=UPI002573025C|nr:SemiSWEET transporter [Geobacter sulfurreducens]BEH10539.1 SemiSWEET transporter [Geobacter sulfurreducens subsp. ethanolicus]HML78502.1 SemiSWEET transporter [Geobacter sulfurreducens]
MTVTTLLGLTAGILTSVAAIPQVIRAFRTKRVRDISIWQPVLLVTGLFLWLGYGLLLRDLPLIVANIVSIICNSAVIAMKMSYGRDDNRPADDYPCE